MWLRGRYLATFCSNCFAISRNQIAEMVAAAVLVATSHHPRNRNRTHFTYDLYDEITRLGQTISSTLAGDTARVGTLLLSAKTAPERLNIQFSKNKQQAVGPWGHSWSHR